MRITVIGTGLVGRTFASRLHNLGHEVVVATRDVNETLSRAQESRTGMAPYSQWQAQHPSIELASFADAAARGELVLNATAGVNTLDALQAVGAEALAGKVLIDIALPLTGSPGQPRSLVVANTDSLGEQIQRAFPGTRVVKTLNTVSAAVMVDPSLLPGRHNIFVSGDDPEAKNTTTALLQDLGWPPEDIINLGDIGTARAAEMYATLHFALARVLGTYDFNIAIVMNDSAPHPT